MAALGDPRLPPSFAPVLTAGRNKAWLAHLQAGWPQNPADSHVLLGLQGLPYSGIAHLVRVLVWYSVK